MLQVTLTVVAAAVLGRLVYPRLYERRAARQRPLDEAGIVRGAGPIDLPMPGAPAVLMLHGCGDTPQVMAALAAHVHEAGFAVRVPLFSGHARGLSALRDVSAARWHDETRREYEALRLAHPWVGVVGLSMGGALAISLAAQRGDIPALVLLAPYVAMPPAIRIAARTARVWGFALPYFTSGGRRSIHDANAAAAALGYGAFTPETLHALWMVARDAQRDVRRVHAPTLLVHSREDNRISPPAVRRAFDLLGARDKRLAWVEGAGHVITVDYGHERVFTLTSEWLRAHEGSRDGPAKATANP